jgi:ATP-dependent RNA helicase RhlE
MKVFVLTDFSALGLSAHTLRTIAALGYATPTPIQREAIPHVLSGRDLVGLAQTGTGKTAAFGLPLAERLLAAGHGRPLPKTARSLILAPTRELVNQIATNLKAFVKGSRLSVVSVVGGASINAQSQALQRGADILVATPGRLIDLTERKAVSLREVKFLVLDEADQMLDLGFIHALKRIAAMLGTPRQTLLFSATMPKAIADLAAAYLSDPVRVEVSPPGRTADKVNQSAHILGSRSKPEMLKSLLSARPDALSLVFARTKHGAEKLMKGLVAHGFAATSIHGNKSQGQRDRAIKAFRSGEVRVLVATDVAARGIDIPGVTHVYNYDLPEVAEAYVHRIGRTARAGAAGEAIALVSHEDVPLLRAVERLTKQEIAIASGAEHLPVGNVPRQTRKPGGRGRPQPARPQGKPAQPHHKPGVAPRAGEPARPKKKPNWRRRRAARAA